jgi:hypothetical protein
LHDPLLLLVAQLAQAQAALSALRQVHERTESALYELTANQEEEAAVHAKELDALNEETERSAQQVSHCSLDRVRCSLNHYSCSVNLAN